MRSFYDEPVTSAACWSQPEEEALRCHCYPVAASWTGSIDPPAA